jgi:predicted RNA-binding Zn-ribbon protein involved in translation (DUF1610 family)
MADQDEPEVAASSAEILHGRVFLPCPECRRAVLIEPSARIETEPPTYECPACGTTFVVV